MRAFAEEPVIEDLVADRTPLEGVGVGLCTELTRLEPEANPGT